jgi:putative ABC transport system permease protein
MFKNYLLMSFKVLSRRKFFTFVSLFGICFTLIVLTVVVTIIDHTIMPAGEEADRGEMLILNRLNMSGEKVVWNGMPGYKFLDRYTRDLPGVEEMSIFSYMTERGLSFIDGEKMTSNIRYADIPFWRLFHFTFIAGYPFTEDDDRQGRNAAVITETTSIRYFGHSDAVGKIIVVNGRRLHVVGVVQDIALYQMLTNGDIFLPIGSYPNVVDKESLVGDFQAVFKVGDSRDFDLAKEGFQARLPLVEFDDTRYETIQGRLRLPLEILADQFQGKQGDEDNQSSITLMFLIAFGAMILFMALPAINLVNINMSRIFERSSEIGVRKAFGASSLQLVGQFLMENVVLCLIGTTISIIMAWGILTVITTAGIIPDLDIHFNFRILGGAVLIALIFAAMSGVGPAWRMSRMKPVIALKGDSR